MVTRLRSLIAVVLCVAVQVLVAQPAVAIDPTISVTPNTNLTAGQTVTVNGSGWVGAAMMNFVQCATEFGCVTGGTPTASADQDGNFSVSFVVSGVINSGSQFPGSANCASEPGRCYIYAFERGSRNANAPLAFSPYPTDGQIRNRQTGALYGDDVYTIPPYAYGQSRSHSVVQGGKWTFALRIENDGEVTDGFTVTGPAGQGPIAVQYFFGYYDITSLVTGTGFTFPDLEPGAAFIFAIRFAADGDAQPGSTRSHVLTFASRRVPAAQDAIKVGVVVVAP